MTDASLAEFPLRGATVASVLQAGGLDPQDLCVVLQLETLCSTDCLALGELWQRVATGDEITLPLGELLHTLAKADQVISLDVRLILTPKARLYVEDGEVLENTLR